MTERLQVHCNAITLSTLYTREPHHKAVWVDIGRRAMMLCVWEGDCGPGRNVMPAYEVTARCLFIDPLALLFILSIGYIFMFRFYAENYCCTLP